MNNLIKIILIILVLKFLFKNNLMEKFGLSYSDNCETYIENKNKNCHVSCKSCGYSDDPSGPDDCIECNPGYKHKKIYEDGTGSCTPDSKSDQAATPISQDEAQEERATQSHSIIPQDVSVVPNKTALDYILDNVNKEVENISVTHHKEKSIFTLDFVILKKHIIHIHSKLRSGYPERKNGYKYKHLKDNIWNWGRRKLKIILDEENDLPPGVYYYEGEIRRSKLSYSHGLPENIFPRKEIELRKENKKEANKIYAKYGIIKNLKIGDTLALTRPKESRYYIMDNIIIKKVKSNTIKIISGIINGRNVNRVISEGVNPRKEKFEMKTKKALNQIDFVEKNNRWDGYISTNLQNSNYGSDTAIVNIWFAIEEIIDNGKTKFKIKMAEGHNKAWSIHRANTFWAYYDDGIFQMIHRSKR